MKFSLKIKLIISYVLISFLLVGSLFYTTKYLFNKQFENYVQKNLEKSSIQIVNQVISAYDNNGNPPSSTTLLNIGEAALAKGFVLSVYDQKGNMIWCMNEVNQNMCSNMLMDMEDSMNNIYLNFNGEYTEKSYEINKNGSIYGNVTLGYYGPFYYTNNDVQFLNMFNQIFMIGAILSFIIAVLFGIFMADKIGSPIKKVIEHTAKIESGNYNERIEIKSNTNEVDNLIHSVNSLASTLNRQHLIRKRMAQDYAHELRTPLASLQSNIEAMIDGIWRPDKTRLESLNEEILRLTRMLNGIEKIAEIEDNKLVLNKTRFDIYEFIKKIMLNFESYLRDKNITFTIDGEQCTAYGDKDKIGQVIINLISNSIKYTGSGGKISIKIDDSPSEVKFSVADNGIGIDEEDLPYIFEHLYRADKSRASETGGNGMGLSVAKSIVDAHQGKITVESNAQSGSKFTVILPK